MIVTRLQVQSVEMSAIFKSCHPSLWMLFMAIDFSEEGWGLCCQRPRMSISRI